MWFPAGLLALTGLSVRSLVELWTKTKQAIEVA